MKRKVFVVAIFLLLVLILLWYYLPTSFLKTVNTETISSIHVFNATNGSRFVIEEAEDISYITERIQEQSFQKVELALFQKGGIWYTLSFYNAAGKETDNISVTSDRMVRKDPFFYQADGDMEIMDRMQELEELLADKIK